MLLLYLLLCLPTTCERSTANINDNFISWTLTSKISVSYRVKQRQIDPLGELLKIQSWKNMPQFIQTQIFNFEIFLLKLIDMRPRNKRNIK